MMKDFTISNMLDLNETIAAELFEGKTADEILKLTICEPAMGSAAFLNEAINQLAEAYISRKEKETGETLSSYLNDKIFAGQTGTTLQPEPEDVKGFEAFLEEYKRLLPAEKAAVAAK